MCRSTVLFTQSPGRGFERTMTSSRLGAECSRSRHRKRIAIALCAVGMLSSGCLPRQMVMPDERYPHQIAEDTEIEVLMRLPDGARVQQEITARKGWYLLAPRLVDAPLEFRAGACDSARDNDAP